MKPLNITYDQFIHLYSQIPEFKLPESFIESLNQAKNLIDSLPRNIRILIFTDSNDFDGLGGGAIQFLSLINLGFNNVSIYGSGDRSTLPGNINDFDLLITNDVGININYSSFENPSKFIIVTDHHIGQNIQSTNNKIYVCLTNICGAYISYLLFSQFENKLSSSIMQTIFEYAAIATISDGMPINTFNKMNIQKLYSIIRNTINSQSLGPKIESKAFYYLIKDSLKYFDYATMSFNVIPKLNAPMKLNNKMNIAGEYYILNNRSTDDWQLVMTYLLTDDYDIAIRLNNINEKRKNITTSIQQEITQILSYNSFINQATENEQFINNNKYSIKYTKYIIEVDAPVQNHISGLIASKLSEYYKIPVIVNAKFNSSIRGPDAFKILEIPEIKANLEHYGGHAEAAGFKRKDNFELDLSMYKPKQEEKQEHKQEEIDEDLEKLKDLKNIRISLDDKLKKDVDNIINWVRSNIPFQFDPVFTKTIQIKKMYVLKGLHTKIIDTDGYDYMYFFHSDINTKCKIGDKLQVAFKIGNTNSIIEILDIFNQTDKQDEIQEDDIILNINYSNVTFGGSNFSENVPTSIKQSPKPKETQMEIHLIDLDDLK